MKTLLLNSDCLRQLPTRCFNRQRNGRRLKCVLRLSSLSREESHNLVAFSRYLGDQPFWFDGGNNDNIETPIVIGTGDGRTTHFFLRRNAFAPSLIVRIDRVIEHRWALDESTGLLILDVAPSAGAIVTAMYRCRFRCVLRAGEKKMAIEEVGVSEGISSLTGRKRISAVGARFLLVEFLNCVPVNSESLGHDHPLFWLLYEVKWPKGSQTVRYLQEKIIEELAPILDPSPRHSSDNNAYLDILVSKITSAKIPDNDPLLKDLYRLVALATEDGKFLQLKRCSHCKKFFVAADDLRRTLCTVRCERLHKRRLSNLRQKRHRQIEKERLAEESRQVKKVKAFQLFTNFMKSQGKSNPTENELTILRPILKRLGKGEIRAGRAVIRA
jgi:hypothetical protein